MHKLKLHFAAAFFLLVAGCAGCAQLGLAPADTFNERVAYSLATHTAVLQATTNALNAGSISSADGEMVAKLADESRALIDAARVVEASGDIKTANGRLLLATNILVQLQGFINSRDSTP